MHIYKHQPLYLIQLTFRRGDEKAVYLTLSGTDIKEVKELLQELFQSGNKVSKKTRIEIRERLGGKNGKYTAHSFYGESAIKTRRKLINYLSNN